MHLNSSDFYREPDPEPRRVETNWHEDLVVVKVGKFSLGIEATPQTLKVVVDVLEFTQLLHEVEKDQMSDDIARIVLSMEGK